MNAADLQKLLDEATPGELQLNRVSHLSVETEAGRGVASCGGYYDNTSDGRYAEENSANARLFVLTKRLARRVIAAEKLAEALRVACQHGRIDDSESRMNMCGAALAEWDATQ